MPRKSAKTRLFRSLNEDDLFDWAGGRVAGQGLADERSGKVEDVRLAKDGSVLAWVQGPPRHATWVDVGEEAIASLCDCPTEDVCRHVVATALAYQTRLRQRLVTPDAAPTDPRVVILEELSGEELVPRPPVKPTSPPPVAGAGAFALHALWGPDNLLHLWVEDGTRTAGQRRPVRSQAHPFAADHHRGWRALDLAGAPHAGALDRLALSLLLPSGPSAPQPSPEALGGEPGEGPATRLASWSVPTWGLAPGEPMVSFLLALPATAPGLRIGDSVRYWAEAAKLALEALARGRVLPALAGNDARWHLVADEDLAERMQLLARAMPPLCRAADPEEAPGAILARMLNATVDACARYLLRDQALAPPPRRGQHRREPAAAYLVALTAPATAVAGSTGELRSLARALEEWTGEQPVLPATALRTCFRLEPPEADGAPWRLEFLLQAADDPSLVVPAANVWQTRGTAFTYLNRTLEHPQDRLLADLGRATRLYPALDPALKTSKPAGLELDSQGAYDFLLHAAPLLEQAGFGVLVPAWWRQPAHRLGARLVATPAAAAGSSGLLNTDSLCDYRWEIALGDTAIPWSEFKRLASLKVPLVQVRGQWVVLKPEEIEAALAFFKKRQPEGEMGVAEALRIGLGVTPSPLGLPVVGVEARGWLGELLAGNGERKLAAAKTPAGFKGKLRPYQERGLAWLSFLDGLGLGACLADDMGLGKTAQALALLLAERQGRRPARRGPTLLVCPMSVVGNWQREASRFAPRLKVHVHHGGGRLSGEEFAREAGASDMVLTTYALAARDQALLAGVKWDRIVLDEAQNIKNSAARQAKAVRTLATSRRVALTGTPVENRLSELWSIMDFLNPGLLGSASDFRSRFATPIERYREPAAADLLRKLTGPFILRRLKTDRTIIQDLPDKLEMKVYCNLTREQASLYQAVVDEMMQQIEATEGITRKGLVLATMLKLKQVCNHPAHFLQDGSRLDDRSGKLARLEEVLDEALAEGDKALVFTQFAEMGHLLAPHLLERLGRDVLYLHGGTPRKARDGIVERFQDPAGPPVLLLSLKAGGTGLNLTAATHVIHFDRWWNPAVEDQATDRAFRIGQRRDVQVRKFVCVGTLEERIDQMIEQKKDLAERIVGAGESWLTELSTAQIREIVALSADAVAED